MRDDGALEPFDVVGIGVAVRDITVRLDPFPDHDSKVRALDLAETGGGPVATALVTISRLGGRAAWIGPLGDDDASHFIERSLLAEGVDTRGAMRRPAAASPASVILVEPGGARRVCEWRQSDLHLAPDDLRDLDGIIEGCRALLVDGRYPEAQGGTASRVHLHGGLVAIDCGHPRPGAEALLAQCDVAVLSHSYARALDGGSLTAESFVRRLSEGISRDGRQIAGLTLGEEGCILAEGGGAPRRFPAVRIESTETVDTTGAGDVFHGALLFELVRGVALAEAAAFANAAAAFSCTRLTGRAPIPGEEEIRHAAWTGRI